MIITQAARTSRHGGCLLEISGLTRRFGATAAVDGITLSIPAGQMVGVIGRSSAGESTLLRTIDRLQEPSSGSIRFGQTPHVGHDIYLVR